MARFDSDGAGKGDSYRDVNKKKYDENFDRIFGKKPLNIMKEKEDEETEGSETKRNLDYDNQNL